jgi:hypothetical protein
MSAFVQGRHRPAGSMRAHFVVKCRNRSFMSTRPSVMGPMMSSLPSECHAAELMLLSVVNAWPPHHAVRGSGEPI